LSSNRHDQNIENLHQHRLPRSFNLYLYYMVVGFLSQLMMSEFAHFVGCVHCLRFGRKLGANVCPIIGLFAGAS
jgi:hypothetical protein